MAVIDFLNYRVVKMAYEKNNQFDVEKGQNLNIENNITAEISLVGEDEAIITLGLKIEENEHGETPFFIDVEITGSYKYNINEDEFETGFEKFLMTNGAAILYPYLRNIVSTLTNLANDFPTYVLPTVNVSKVLSQNNTN